MELLLTKKYQQVLNSNIQTFLANVLVICHFRCVSGDEYLNGPSQVWSHSINLDFFRTAELFFLVKQVRQQSDLKKRKGIFLRPYTFLFNIFLFLKVKLIRSIYHEIITNFEMTCYSWICEEYHHRKWHERAEFIFWANLLYSLSHKCPYKRKWVRLVFPLLMADNKVEWIL